MGPCRRRLPWLCGLLSLRGAVPVTARKPRGAPWGVDDAVSHVHAAFRPRKAEQNQNGTDLTAEAVQEDRMRKNATCEAAIAGNLRVVGELSKYEWHEFGANALCTRRKIIVSKFGQLVAKLPKTFIDKVKEMNHTKIRQFNFQGSMDYEHPSRKERRQWIFPFAAAHFGETDLLRLTDARSNGSYVPLGSFDTSLARNPQATGADRPRLGFPFDVQYFRELASSSFTLCPGGDHGWSFRIWEAAAAGSICVIRSLESDVNGNDLLCRIPFKFYSINSSFRFRQDVADHNFRMLVKYQTFLEGDNVPPKGCSAMIVE